MATRRQTYINAELEWAEQKLLEWRQYVDDNPFQSMKDRIEWKPTSKGGMIPMVIASIESQIKCVRDTMKEYLLLLEQVERMRQVEENKKVDVKGGEKRPARM